MILRSNFLLLLLPCIMTATTYAQNEQSPLLDIGDSAPPIRVKEWIKGTALKKFEKGQVYVLEFWATWCKPCIAAMPHLSDLARMYKDKVTIIGINIKEKKTTSIKEIKKFVENMGYRMDYKVAIQDSNFMEIGWLEASGEQGIPTSFIVNANGRVAWIGYPKELNEILPQIVNNTWDINAALNERNLNKKLEKMDSAANDDLNLYVGDAFTSGDMGKPDSALIVINEIIRNEPKLKYAPCIAFHTFSSLLKTNQDQAYKYGKEMLLTATYKNSSYYSIIDVIIWYSDKINLTKEIYQLGAEAYQLKIDQIPYPELVNMSKFYKKTADMYWRADNKLKAIEALQKAIEVLKGQKDFSAIEMAEFESRLRQYKNM